MDLKEKYTNICFSIDEKIKELENFRADIFTLQPQVSKIIEELTELEKEKKELEEKING